MRMLRWVKAMAISRLRTKTRVLYREGLASLLWRSGSDCIEIKSTDWAGYVGRAHSALIVYDEANLLGSWQDHGC